MISFGHDPIMSDQAEVIFDPQIHTHASCLREVENCDVVVLVVGSRFGGAVVPKALDLIDLGRVGDMSRADRFWGDGMKVSITQAEILKAIQHGIPVFAFVDSSVMRDHLTYEKNKNKSIISQIEFSSIEKTETAAYIFEFINFLRLRNENNSIFEFSRFEDIEVQLKKQWSGLFQRLLSEQRSRAFEGRTLDQLSSQIADLKAAVLGSISSGKLKETAKGAIRFRTLIDFAQSLAVEYKPDQADELLRSKLQWGELLAQLGIVEVRRVAYGARAGGMLSVLIREDGTYYKARLAYPIVSRLESQWDDFKQLDDEARDAIINAVLDSRNGRGIGIVKHVPEPYIEDAPSISGGDEEEDLIGSIPTSSRVRILLTKEKYIEDSLKNFLSSDSAFEGMSFLVDVVSDHVVVSVVSAQTEGMSRSFSYSYSVPEDHNLAEPIEILKNNIKRDVLNAKAAH
jgi:hypothetical protein